jgi:hypothetical protein
VLRPVFERMRAESPNFLQRNATVAKEFARALVDLDKIEGQLRKTGTQIGRAQLLTTESHVTLRGLCDRSAAGRTIPDRRRAKMVALATRLATPRTRMVRKSVVHHGPIRSEQIG